MGIPGQSGIADVRPWPDWLAAAEGALAFLHEQFGWDVWAVTRVEGAAQVVVRASPPGAVPPGTALSWDASFCRQMVTGRAPRVATVTAAVPEYARCSVGLAADVAAYLGVPLVTRGGELYGTLCALSFRAQPRRAALGLPTVEFAARMLSTLLAVEPEGPLPAPRAATPDS
ncbi:GAF domain-containing protein [Geodermatophilus sp. SYSU D00815]